MSHSTPRLQSLQILHSDSGTLLVLNWTTPTALSESYWRMSPVSLHVLLADLQDGALIKKCSSFYSAQMLGIKAIWHLKHSKTAWPLKKEALGWFEPSGATHPMVESHPRRPKHQNNVFLIPTMANKFLSPIYNIILTPTTCWLLKYFYVQ